jgi:hypothetical protein
MAGGKNSGWPKSECATGCYEPLMSGGVKEAVFIALARETFKRLPPPVFLFFLFFAHSTKDSIFSRVFDRQAIFAVICSLEITAALDSVGLLVPPPAWRFPLLNLPKPQSP